MFFFQYQKIKIEFRVVQSTNNILIYICMNFSVHVGSF